jgi:hypothetical protein
MYRTIVVALFAIPGCLAHLSDRIICETGITSGNWSNFAAVSTRIKRSNRTGSVLFTHTGSRIVDKARVQTLGDDSQFAVVTGAIEIGIRRTYGRANTNIAGHCKPWRATNNSSQRRTGCLGRKGILVIDLLDAV